MATGWPTASTASRPPKRSRTTRKRPRRATPGRGAICRRTSRETSRRRPHAAERAADLQHALGFFDRHRGDLRPPRKPRRERLVLELLRQPRDDHARAVGLEPQQALRPPSARQTEREDPEAEEQQNRRRRRVQSLAG